MRLADQFRFNLLLFVRHRIRTILLLLAVGAGVASVILLTSLGEGARRYIDAEFSSLGNRLLVVLPGKKETTGGTPPIYGAVPRDLTLEDAYALEKIPGITAVAPIIAGTASVSQGSLSREVITIGTTLAYFEIRELAVGQGSKFPARVKDEAMPVCLLGAKLRRELFGSQQAIGEWLRVGDRRFRVIGVLAERGESLGLDFRDMIMIPVRSAEQLFNSPGLFRIILGQDDVTDTNRTQAAIIAMIKARHDGEDDITIVSQDAMLSAFNDILKTLTLVIGAIAAISLLVAGILIMNISLISVSQRREEIGLLKAVGASAIQVRNLFLGESLLLVLMGSAAGVITAVALISATGRLWPAFPIAAPWWSYPAAVGVALVAGVVFSLMPARKAASLDPVLALKGLAG
jgi:putative ABC transport system permease protein